jgi:hypothetical protein
MHEPAPILPDPESERRGHELRDVAAKPIVIFLIVLILLGGVLQAVMSFIMTGFVAQEAKIAAPLSLDELRDFGVGDHPPPQVNTTDDMLRMYDEEDVYLNVKEPTTDKRTGKVRIAIDRAIDIVARKGLPHRDAAPKSAIDPELPYPKRSRPFMATP